MTEQNIKPEIDLIQDIITKSEDEFEKKITYISAGALLLSVTLLEKVIQLEDSNINWVLYFGWATLTLTLFINLISHLISKIYLRKNIDEIDDNTEYSKRLKNHKNRLFLIESINWVTVSLLFLGIIALVTFASFNAKHSTLKKTININNVDQNKTIIIQKN